MQNGNKNGAVKTLHGCLSLQTLQGNLLKAEFNFLSIVLPLFEHAEKVFQSKDASIADAHPLLDSVDHPKLRRLLPMGQRASDVNVKKKLLALAHPKLRRLLPVGQGASGPVTSPQNHKMVLDHAKLVENHFPLTVHL